MSEHCYCGSSRAFAECCEPIIQGAAKARTPEELMRARFSAHCTQSFQFLVDSIHPDHREGVSVEELEQWSPKVNWEKLEVHSATPGETDDTGTVSYTAHYTVKDVAQELREDSTFRRENGEWMYIDGIVHGEEPYRRENPKVGRNDPCPCGSGLKYKKCHGK